MPRDVYVKDPDDPEGSYIAICDHQMEQQEDLWLVRGDPNNDEYIEAVGVRNCIRCGALFLDEMRVWKEKM